MLKKNDCVPLTVSGMTAEGMGVGRFEGFAVFVSGAAPGDELIARIIKVTKNYAAARIEELLSPSPARIRPDCPLAARCGGCQFRHIAYEEELKLKEQRVKDAVSRIGGADPSLVRPVRPSPRVLRYRNKAQLPLGTDREGAPVAGFYALHSHRIVPMEDCLLQPEIFSRIQKTVLRWIGESGNTVYREETGTGTLRHLYLRQAEETGDITVCLAAAKEPRDIPSLSEKLQAFPEVKSFLINYNPDRTNVILGKKYRIVFGDGLLHDRLCGVPLTIAPDAFYQVNHAAAELLYRIAGEYAAPEGAVLLDLYCGTGSIGLSMASRAKKLIGVEIVKSAVEGARQNARQAGLHNCEFLCMDASEAAARLKEQGLFPDVIVIDPPRKGCDSALIHTVGSMAPKRVVYVSCDPATMARDLARFREEGYLPKEITPVDMFPRTANVETVVSLSQLKSDV